MKTFLAYALTSVVFILISALLFCCWLAFLIPIIEQSQVRGLAAFLVVLAVILPSAFVALELGIRLVYALAFAVSKSKVKFLAQLGKATYDVDEQEEVSLERLRNECISQTLLPWAFCNWLDSAVFGRFATED